MKRVWRVVALGLFGITLILSVGCSASGKYEGDASTFVFVMIPESIWPVARGEKYEDPIHTALQQDGLGEVTGGGSQVGPPGSDGEPTIEWVGIDIELFDLPRGLALLRSELKRIGAPAGTTFEYEHDGKRVSESL
ncbi:hypothetical protein V3391_13700 [Luteimonas sp. SMYT11W]|uniref:Uncharacterized protein n=1 Tax=Luteimonas flava TaxID=3115822 RepID=A0ABU7WH15_9GAMM